MAFGIPNSDGGNDSGPFLNRIQFDARSGFFMNVDRVQDSAGEWVKRESDPYRGPVFAADFGSFMVGYIKLTGTPAFLLAPMGQPIPQQPSEMTAPDKNGKTKHAFMPGFRIQVMSQKTFGDMEPRYFSGTSKALMGAMEELYMAFQASAEARAGKIPLVSVASTRTIEIKSKEGTSKFYAPVFAITGWIERPEGFGERTVPAPGGAAVQAAPAPKPTPAPVRQPEPAMAGGGYSPLDDDIPFAPEFR